MNSSSLLSHLIDLIGNVADAHTTALFELKENQLVMREHFTLSNYLNEDVSISVGEGPIGLAAKTLKTQLLENIDSDIGGIYEKPEDLKGFLAIPIVSNGLMGVLVIDTKTSYQISIKLQKILSSFAEQISWHLNQEKHGFNLKDRPLLDLKEINSYCRFLAESPNRSSVADRLIQIPTSLVSFKSIAVIWFEENQQEGRIMRHIGFTNDLSKIVVRFGKGLVGSCAKNRSPLLLQFNSERKNILFSEEEKSEGLLSALTLPIKLNETLYGVLLVGSDQFEGLDSSDLDKLSLIVSAAASALFCADTKDRWTYDKNLDPVTGVPNHRFLSEYQVAVSEELFKPNQPVYFWSIQITNLSDLYQIHGVDQGDAFLKQMIAIFAKVIPSPKFIFRFSENTFVLMLMSKKQKEVKQLESKLKQIFDYNPQHVNGTAMRVNMEWGLSVYPNEANDLFSLISLSRNRLSPKIKETV